MAKVFLDANRLIDLTQGRGDQSFALSLESHQVFISPLSVRIMFYLGKITVPDQKINGAISQFQVINFSKKILRKALEGPTADLEDNIQLHSATEEDCDYFLTNDKNILKMKFFGKARIAAGL